MGKVRLNLMDAFEYLINDRTCGLWRAVDTNWCGVYSGKKKNKKLVWGTILNERQDYRLRQPFPYVIIGYNIHGRHFQLWDSLVKDFHWEKTYR